MADGCTLLILAGGRSRRMGRDKATLPVGELTLTQHLAHRLAAVVDETLVAAGDAPADSELKQVIDRVPEAGPLAGMHAGLLAARFPLVWVIACDLPDVEPRLGPLLCRLVAGVDAAVPMGEELPQGLCAVYQRRLGPRIQELLEAGERSVRALLRAIDVRYVTSPELKQVDPQLRSFRNLNTAADYEAWLKSR
jgi:molybdopterin-guanine dinucleotide biosynthesis protein A